MGCIVGCIRWALIQTNVTKVWLWPQSQLYASAQNLFLLPPASCPGSLWPQQGEFSNSKEANPPSTPQTNPNGQKHCWKWPSLISKAAIVFFLTTKGVVRSDVLTEILIFTDILELVLGLLAWNLGPMQQLDWPGLLGLTRGPTAVVSPHDSPTLCVGVCGEGGFSTAAQIVRSRN